MRRREVLAGLLALGVAGCSHAPTRPPAPTPTERPSPSPVSEQSEFMQFSALITGFSVDDLDTDVAAQIVEAVNEGPGGAQALQAMLQQAQGCHTLADLEQRVFTNQAHQELADDILEAWFTGVVSYPKGPVVATFMGSLAWQCLGYTGAPSACHEPWWTHPVAPS